MNRNKGHFVCQALNDFTVIDLETTGLSTECDEIIEIVAYKVRNGVVVDKYESLINPGFAIPSFIEELTGITDEMLENKPSIEMVISDFYDFIKGEVLLGHNVHFDLNFLYDAMLKYLGVELNNNYIDTLRISRKVYPEFKSHKLKVLSKELRLSSKPTHRAAADVSATLELYEKCKAKAKEEGLVFEKLFVHKHKGYKVLTKEIRNSVAVKDETILNKEVFVFTGKLEKMDRKEAWKLVLENGGEIGNSVTSKTNYLVLGNTDYCYRLRGSKTSKMRKAETLILNGADLEIIPENVFYEMININS